MMKQLYDLQLWNAMSEMEGLYLGCHWRGDEQADGSVQAGLGKLPLAGGGQCRWALDDTHSWGRAFAHSLHGIRSLQFMLVRHAWWCTFSQNQRR